MLKKTFFFFRREKCTILCLELTSQRYLFDSCFANKVRQKLKGKHDVVRRCHMIYMLEIQISVQVEEGQDTKIRREKLAR